MVTSLIEAIETNDPEMVELILDNGGAAFVNVYSFMGIAPLHHVIMSADTLASAYSKKESTFLAEKLKIIEMLLAAGADINSKLFSRHHSNWSILEISIYFGFKQILHYILFHTDIDLTNLDYSTVELTKFNDYLLTDDIQDLEFINTWKNNYKQITYDIIFEILRRKELGLFSNEETLMRINFPPTHIDVGEDEHLRRMEKIKAEINGVVSEMKTEKISSSDITFWKILTVGSNDLVKLAFNKNLRALCIENYEGKYYIYYDILKKRLDYAIGKSISLEKTLELLDVLVKNQLTYDCRERIINFLDDDELCSFISTKTYI